MAQSLTIQRYPIWFHHYKPYITPTSTQFNKILFIFKILNILYKNYNFNINTLNQTSTPILPFKTTHRKPFLTLTMSRY